MEQHVDFRCITPHTQKNAKFSKYISSNPLLNILEDDI